MIVAMGWLQTGHTDTHTHDTEISPTHIQERIKTWSNIEIVYKNNIYKQILYTLAGFR